MANVRDSRDVQQLEVKTNLSKHEGKLRAEIQYSEDRQEGKLRVEMHQPKEQHTKFIRELIEAKLALMHN